MRTIRTTIITIFIVLMTMLLSACSEDSDDREPGAWVRIDSPVDGFSTGKEYVTVEGNASMGNAFSVPGPIYWFNNGASGVLPSQNICIFGCIAAFQGSVPLFMGANTITVQLDDGSDTVNGIRYPQVVAQGSVVMDTTGYVVPGVTITISGDRNYSAETDAGGMYSFSYLRDGSYSVHASLRPLSTGCLSLTPDKHDFVVVMDDIHGLDFTASQLTPCYTISGHIAATTNPYADISGVKLTLIDTYNNEYVVYSNVAGNYTFYHLVPGSYSITPSDRYGGTYIPETSTRTIAIGDVTSLDFDKVFD